MFRYMAVIWDPSQRAQAETTASLVRRLHTPDGAWQTVLAADGMRVFCTGATPGGSGVTPLPGQAGVILGTLFERSKDPLEPATPVGAQLKASEASAIVGSNGAQLLSSYWGRYVAFLFDARSSRKCVLKDPTGRLPCFRTSLHGITVFFSCLADCVNLRFLSFDINWSYITTRIGRALGDWGQTGLQGVTELVGGTCIEFCGDRISERVLWNPMAIADSDILDEPHQAAYMVRATVNACTAAWASAHAGILCRTSGGLDSSIVLACLKEAPTHPQITCVTYYGSGTGSDELTWARIAAGHFGYDIEPCECEVRVPIEALQAMGPLASPPADYSWALAGDSERELANRRGATAVMTGDGGDSVFGRYSVDFACADFLRHRGLRPQLLSLAVDVALLRNQSVWSVLKTTVRSDLRKQRRKDIERLKSGRMLVQSDVFEAATSDAAHKVHPWFATAVRCAASDVVEMVVQPDLFYHPLHSPGEFELEPLYPLCSQPLVELCLRIPSYTHMDEGRSRGLARRAFRAELPEAIFRRQWKDAAQELDYRLIRENAHAIREFLLDGILVEKGYLNRERVDRSLSDEPSKQTAVIHEVTDHLIVEAWLRTWSDARYKSIAA